jgi:hypothetical protein
MDRTSVDVTPKRYLVELKPAGSRFADIQSLSARSRSACRDMSRSGVDVRFLRSVFVPDDGICFLLFEAASRNAVKDAGRRALLPIARISETVRLRDAGGNPDSSNKGDDQRRDGGEQ